MGPWRRIAALTVVVAAAGWTATPGTAQLPQQTGVVDLLDQANLRIDGAVAGDAAGYSVAGAGDVNGDGLADVIVGARYAGNNARSNSGAAYVLFGQATPANVDLAALGPAGFRIDGAASFDTAGWAVGGAGDVNGDGLADVIVGAPGAGNNGRTGSGSAYVVFGRATTATVDLADLGAGGFRIDGQASGHELGGAVAGAGDVNGDGLADVIVSARLAGNNSRATSGSAYVVFGQRGTTSVDLASLASGFRIDGAAAGDQAGWSVGGGGDVNGDGRPDVIVGATGADNNGRSGSGSAYVVFGRNSTATVDLAALGTGGFRIDGGAAGDQAGYAVGNADDVSGDGYADVVVGAPSADNNARTDSGSAYVVFGRPATSSVDLAPGSGGIRIDGGEAGDSLGGAVAGAGDVNGDGRPDVIVGATQTSHNLRAHAGSAYVVYGLPSTAYVDVDALGAGGFRIDGAAGDDFAGNAVAGAGDINGDGRPDVLVGAPDMGDNSRAGSGSAYAVLGFGAPALTYTPDSVRATTGQPITLAATVRRTGPATFGVTPPLPAGISLDAARGTIAGTPTSVQAATLYTVTMSDLAGSTTSSVLIQVDAPPAGGGDRVAPVLSALRLMPAVFRPARSGPGIAVRTGTTIRFSLSERATTAFTVRRATTGARRAGACVKRTRKLARARRCVRYVRVAGSLRRTNDAGANRLRFMGRVGGRALRPGRYRLVATPKDAAGNIGTARQATFRVVR